MAESAAVVMARADALAAFTEVEGELTRPYGSASLRRALDAVAGWMADAGLEVRHDALGSVIGRLGGSGRAVVLGSHLDSVRDAGCYDGPLGVLVALAAVERLGRSPRGSVEVVAFADEEGLRFHVSYLASRAVAGLVSAEELERVDRDGVTVAKAIRAMGGDPEALAVARWDPARLAAYLEVHIEQGPVLEAEALPVGIVTGIAGQSRGSVRIEGRAGHAGNTPPALRCDALAGAAELVLSAERAMAEAPGLTATVGRLDVSPNVPNVIPGAAVASYDVRHGDDEVRESAVGALRAAAAEICERRGLELDWQGLQDHPAVPMSPRLREVLRRCVAAAGVRLVELPSGAGHDAVSIAHLTEVAMLFVRCRGGVSHHPDESVREADVAVAVDVVRRFLLEIRVG